MILEEDTLSLLVDRVTPHKSGEDSEDPNYKI